MNTTFLSMAAVLVLAQVFLPRRYAFAPLLISACHVGTVEFLGELSLPRLLVLVGLGRAVMTGQFRLSLSNAVDRCFLAFAVAALLTATAHDTDYNFYVSNLGLILNVCGSYLYGRAYLQGIDWWRDLARVSVIVAVPLAMLMVYEVVSGKNPYSVLGINSGGVFVRDGEIRARGPFRHAILAGTAGAVLLPLCMILWRDQRVLASMGIAASLTIVFTSTSSGPVAAALAAGVLVWCWRKREHVPKLKWAIPLGIILLSLYMDRPFYYIIDSIDFTGGSTGWHRARLIEMGIEHLGEWWLAGTDFTRHWMPTGVSWNADHTDITNYYLHLGVIGGLPLMLSLIAIVWFSFGSISRFIRTDPDDRRLADFALWCLGCSLAAHALSFISISYFDQMYVLFYLLVGGIGGLVEIPELNDELEPEPDDPAAENAWESVETPAGVGR
jgi:hypothetical protein